MKKNDKIKKVIKLIIDSEFRKYFFLSRGWFKHYDDKKALDCLFKYKIGKNIAWDNPQSFNEKLQWIKLYDRNPLYTVLVDKISSKEYVRNIIGDKYVVPTLGIYKRFDDINFEELPKSFVIKCNNDSGGVCICKDKATFDKKRAKRKIEKAMRTNFYWKFREWAYKDIEPKIIVEEYLEAVAECDVPEYKIFCFDGTAKMIDVCMGKAHTLERTNDYCDMNLNRLPFTSLLPNSKGNLEKPLNYQKMIEIAEKLSKGFPEVRMDFYNIEGKIYFGEFTFTSNAGMEKFEPEEWDYNIGKWIKLPS